MSTQSVSLSTVNDFSERTNRLFNRSQKLRDSMVEFGQKWGIELNHLDVRMTTVPEQHSQATVQEEPAVHADVPVEENHENFDLDGLLAGINLGGEEQLSL